jgi:hypothetical protein
VGSIPSCCCFKFNIMKHLSFYQNHKYTPDKNIVLFYFYIILYFILVVEQNSYILQVLVFSYLLNKPQICFQCCARESDSQAFYFIPFMASALCFFTLYQQNIPCFSKAVSYISFQLEKTPYSSFRNAMESKTSSLKYA